MIQSVSATRLCYLRDPSRGPSAASVYDLYRRTKAGPALAVVASVGSVVVAVSPVGMVSREEQPARIELERARLQREHPGAIVDVIA